MPASVLQVVKNTAGFISGSASTTIAVTINGVTAGSVLVAVGTWDSISGAGTATCSDGTAYTAIGAVINDSPSNQAFAAFYLKNAGAGSHTVTITINAAKDFRAIHVIEVGGVQNANIDGSNGQVQAAPGTGTDAVTSGNMTNATQPAVIVGYGMDVTQNNIPATGTGFTSSDTDATTGVRVEYKRITTTGSTQLATFTAIANEDHFTYGFIFDEAATVLPPLTWLPPIVPQVPPPPPRNWSLLDYQGLVPPPGFLPLGWLGPIPRPAPLPVVVPGLPAFVALVPAAPPLPPLTWLGFIPQPQLPPPPVVGYEALWPLPLPTIPAPTLSWLGPTPTPAPVPAAARPGLPAAPVQPLPNTAAPPLSWETPIVPLPTAPPPNPQFRVEPAYEAWTGAQSLSWMGPIYALAPLVAPVPHPFAVAPVLPIANPAAPALSWRGPIPTPQIQPPTQARSLVAAPVLPPPAPFGWLGPVPGPQPPPQPTRGAPALVALVPPPDFLPLGWLGPIPIPLPPPVARHDLPGAIVPLVPAPDFQPPSWLPPVPSPAPAAPGARYDVVAAPVAPPVAPPITWLGPTPAPAQPPRFMGAQPAPGPVLPPPVPPLTWLGPIVRPAPAPIGVVGMPVLDPRPLPTIAAPLLSWLGAIVVPAPLPVVAHPWAAFLALAPAPDFQPPSWLPPTPRPPGPPPPAPVGLAAAPVAPPVPPSDGWLTRAPSPPPAAPAPPASAPVAPPFVPPATPPLAWAPLVVVPALPPVVAHPASVLPSLIIPTPVVPDLSWLGPVVVPVVGPPAHPGDVVMPVQFAVVPPPPPPLPSWAVARPGRSASSASVVPSRTKRTPSKG